MINSEIICNGVPNVVPGNNKLPSTAMKKTALRDVQNQTGSLLVYHQENLSFAGGRPASDSVKVCGTKRLTPEPPSASPTQLSLSNNVVNEHIVNARRRFELELGRGRAYNMETISDFPPSRQVSQSQHEVPRRQTQLRESSNASVSVVNSNNMTCPANLTYIGPSIPNYVAKYCNNMQAVDVHKVSSEHRCSLNSESVDERRRTERFINLQKFLKQCDDSYQRNYIQVLLRLSPAELSGHAVELEKRAIQLTIEEGKEIQRMKTLNILDKSAVAGNSLQTAQLHQSRN